MKQANVYVRIAWISFGVLPCRKRNLVTVRDSMLLKSHTSLTCFRACFLPGRVKDLSAPRYFNIIYMHECVFCHFSAVDFYCTMLFVWTGCLVEASWREIWTQHPRAPHFPPPRISFTHKNPDRVVRGGTELRAGRPRKCVFISRNGKTFSCFPRVHADCRNHVDLLLRGYLEIILRNKAASA